MNNKILILGLAAFGVFAASRRFVENRLDKISYEFGRLRFDFSQLITGRILAKIPVSIESKTGIAVKVSFTGFLFLKRPNENQPLALTPINIPEFTLPAFQDGTTDLNLQITLGSLMAVVGTAIQQGKNPAAIFNNKVYIEGIYKIDGVRLPVKRNVTIFGLN